MSIGWKVSAVTVVPLAPISESNVAGSVPELLENVAMNVPESAWVATTSALSTSTLSSWLLTPTEGV